MNPFEFVLILIGMIFLFTIIKQRLGIKPPAGRQDDLSAHDDSEKRQLADEVRALKERIQVLERITVDKENSLSRQIEELRDRP